MSRVLRPAVDVSNVLSIVPDTFFGISSSRLDEPSLMINAGDFRVVFLLAPSSFF